MTGSTKRPRAEINSTHETKYLRINDVAKQLGIGVSTAWKYVREGKLPQAHVKLSPKVTVWLKSDIDKVVEELAFNPNPENDVVNFKVTIKPARNQAMSDYNKSSAMDCYKLLCKIKKRHQEMTTEEFAKFIEEELSKCDTTLNQRG